MTYPKWGWVLGAATVSAVIAFGIASWEASAAPPPGATPTVAAEQATVSNPDPGPAPSAGIGQDALTSTELDKARALAETTALKTGAKDVTGSAGPEYLAADIADADSGRTAELYYYDYHGNRLVKQVVDLAGGKLVASYAAEGMQLPPSEREVKTALELLLANPLSTELKDAYAKATGRPFTGQELSPTAHIYHALPADTGAAQCGKNRCLRLIVQTSDGHILDLDKIIVDLSGRTVARLT
ncbi:hypothetical protein ODJ79_36950 [Actinoplanes sp. KI2]|uniref:hypothetical protein n=1 Tax=Actinoplanes sp. KI2 TaxID=2983315 RepID=UPI0021D5B906|nr:hypothetical protein [Actinoplanes sp. KI2]MCU7729337.1 hypothetical protein [Actinoplanes sp. KI2]